MAVWGENDQIVTVYPIELIAVGEACQITAFFWDVNRSCAAVFEVDESYVLHIKIVVIIVQIAKLCMAAIDNPRAITTGLKAIRFLKLRCRYAATG